MKKKTRNPKYRWLRRSLRVLLSLLLLSFILLNWVAYNHAYQFTHTDPSLQGEHPQGQVYKMKRSSPWQKMGYAFWGISIPKSKNEGEPNGDFHHNYYPIGKDTLDAWWMETNQDSPKGIVVLCHGYGSCKSQMLSVAYWWLNQGYDCLSFDFVGHGSSSGNVTTIGYKEAEQVKVVVNSIKKEYPQQPLILFGSSMGAAAIIKAVHDEDLGAMALVLECPFGSLRQAVLNRFKLMNVPSYGLADLLIFWGGRQHGFWGHGHSPIEYAKKINTPTLILYGEKDPKVGLDEVEAIYKSLNSQQKQLTTLPCAGHNFILSHCPDLWPKTIQEFLSTLK